MKSANAGDYRIRKIEENVFLLEQLTTIGNPCCRCTEWAVFGRFPSLKLAAEYLSKKEVVK